MGRRVFEGFLTAGLLLLAACSSPGEPPGATPDPDPSGPPAVLASFPSRAALPTPQPPPLLSVQPEQAFPVPGNLVPLPGRPVTFPARCALAPDGTLYVADPLAGAVFGYRGARRVFELITLERPLGLAVHGDRLLVGDDRRDSVEAYSRADGSLLFALGAGLGEFQMPNAIAVSPDGEQIFVADSQANQIRVFDATGRGLGTFDGGTDPLRFPVALAVDDQRVAVADQGNHRLQIFDHQGGLLGSIGSLPPDNASSLHQLRGHLVRPQAVAFLEDTIAVLDSAFGTIQVFDDNGTVEGFLGGRGGCDTCVDLALDFAWDAGDRTLILLDPNRRRWVRVPHLLRARP